jgi:WD40 repeat protein
MLRRLGEPSEQIMAVAISADGKHVAAGGGTIDGTSVVRVWNADSGTLDWSSNDHTQEVLAISFSPDGKYIVSGSADGVVRLHEAATGKVTQILSGHAGGATALAFSPDGRRLYCGQAPGGVLIWDVMAGRLLQTYKSGESTGSPNAFDRRMTSIGLSRAGATLATCASSVNNEFVDPVRLWNTQTGALIRDFTPENTHGRPMALSPDGSLIATGGKSVRLRDARTGELLRELNGILKRTQSIVFSSDGRLIIAGGSYGTTNIWDVATGRPLVTLFAFPEQQNGATADAWLAYMPDGHYTGSANIEKYLAWRVGDEFVEPGLLSRELRRPEQIESALRSP